jgi:two-component system sporulation sensor kinase B
MYIDIEVILYQVLIVLFPIFFYHLFFHENNHDRKKPHAIFTFILLIITVMTMSFPIQFSKGYIYDFRIVPFILSFIYGGTVPGLLTGIVLLTYRYIIGGDGFYVVLANYSLSCIFLIFMGEKVKSFKRNKRLVFVSIVFWVNTLIVMASLFSHNQNGQIPFMLIFYTITWVCLVMVVLVMENVNQQFEMRKQLQRDEKLNVISQLAASVAHEVRNPLTSVRGFLQLIQSEENLQATQKNYIQIALNELDHAQTIINDYLSLARPNTEELAAIDISEEVKKTVELMTSYSNIQNISIVTNIQESLHIKANRNEIKQVLVNIMKNGIEAMATGGTLIVNTLEKNGIVSIEIIDSGKGMSKSQLQKLGTLFYTTKEKGTGVGMTISFQLIQAMKGKIDVKSEPGKGTTFTIRFPAV